MSLFSAIPLPTKLAAGALLAISLALGFKVYVGMERRDARVQQERKEEVARLKTQLSNAQVQLTTLQDAAKISVEIGHAHEASLSALRGDYRSLRVRYQSAWNQRAVPVAARPDAPGLTYDPTAAEVQLPPEAVIVSLGDVEQCEVEAGRLTALQSFVMRYNQEISQ